MRVTDEGRWRKEPSNRITPGADRDLGAGQGLQRGGKQNRDGSHKLKKLKTLCLPEREGNKDKRWGPEIGGAIPVDGSSMPGQVGEEKQVQKESEAVLKGEI